MKIALLGYGKMGREIETLAKERNHEIVLKVSKNNSEIFSINELSAADIAIEFSSPASAFANIKKCFEAGMGVVCGTTGWNEKLDEAKKLALQKQVGFFYASNFSIGVHVFSQLNKTLAALMNRLPEYEVSMEEIHHTKKLDAPSGTAITLANGIIENLKRKKSWKSFMKTNSAEKFLSAESEITIASVRENNIVGTHSVTYESVFDEIEIRHEAKSRTAFSRGAILAAEWMNGKKGNFGMDDLLK